MEYELVAGIYKVDRLLSATYLLNPTVSDYDNIVAVRNPELLLYDVRTTVLEDDTIKLFGRKFNTVNPYTFIGTKEEIAENFIIVKNTKAEIRKMLEKRNQLKKKNR